MDLTHRTPEQLRAQVEEIMRRPAPTDEDVVAQLQEAHQILQEALQEGSNG